eukprot:5137447-Pyramimonas_sp.AAC.1
MLARRHSCFEGRTEVLLDTLKGRRCRDSNAVPMLGNTRPGLRHARMHVAVFAGDQQSLVGSKQRVYRAGR